MKCKNCLQKVFWVFEAVRKLWNAQNSLHKKGSFPLRTSLVNVRIWSHLLKKSLTENIIFCAVIWTILRWFVWALSNCAQTNFKKMQFIWIMLYTILLWHSTFREPLVYNISHHTHWALNVNRLGGFRIPECWVLPFYRKSINFFTFYARTANKKRYASTILRNEITLRQGCSSENLVHIFRTPFLNNTSGRLLLKLLFSTSSVSNELQCSISLSMLLFVSKF